MNQSIHTTVISEASEVLNSIYGNRLAKIILFGSYARGTPQTDSDVDLLVVLNEKQFSAVREIRFINDNLFDVSLKHNIPLSAHPVSLLRFQSEKSFFMNRVRKEGKEV